MVWIPAGYQSEYVGFAKLRNLQVANTSIPSLAPGPHIEPPSTALQSLFWMCASPTPGFDFLAGPLSSLWRTICILLTFVWHLKQQHQLLRFVLLTFLFLNVAYFIVNVRILDLKFLGFVGTHGKWRSLGRCDFTKTMDRCAYIRTHFLALKSLACRWQSRWPTSAFILRICIPMQATQDPCFWLYQM